MKQVELINKRKLREKHFLQEDGTIIAKVFDNNVHYKKNDKYEDIDNTLIKQGNIYTNKSNDYKVFYGNKSNDILMKISKDENFIDIKLKNAKEKFGNINELSNDKITYNEILENIDIIYKTLPTKVKETIVLKDKNCNKLTFEINTNLELKVSNNTILALNNGNVVFKIEKPYMEDSNGEVSNDIYYVLRREFDNLELDLVLDNDWLNSEKRSFPIYIDPTITNVCQEVNLYDTYIFPGDNGVNKGSQPILKAGVERVNGTDIVNRTLIKFDLPEIGTGSEIVGAYLTLTGYPVYTFTEGAKTVNMHRVTQDWTETGATWEVMNDKYDERIEAIYFGERSYIEGAEIYPATSNCEGNITNLVKKWYRDTPNYGILLKSANEVYSGEQYPAFCSKNYNDGVSNATYNPMPLFELVYRNMNGLENYLDYLTQNFTDLSTFVNTYTGNMTGIFELGHTIGGKFPVSLKLVYNTNDVVLNNVSIFGKGYKSSLNQIIEEVIIADIQYLQYSDEDGTNHYFVKDEVVTPELYYDEDGLGLTIEKSNISCTMTDKTGGKMIFTKNGSKYYLTEIRDISNNSILITLDSDNNITKITDANNAEINIVYNSNEIQIISPDSTTYLKYTNGILSSIVTVNGTTNIVYNSNNIIDTITDVTGLKVKYEYCTQKPYRISKVTQYGLNDKIGNYFNISYGFNTSTIVDHNGLTQTLMFNQYGNLLSINNLSSSEDISNAYALTRTYGDDISNKNKLLSNSIPTKYIKNYLKNSSFETDDDYFTNCTGVIKSFSTDCSVSGNRSLKIVCDSNYLEHSISWNINNLPKGKHYTLSAYFKTDTKATFTFGYNAVDITSSCRSETKNIEVSDEFVRKDITIYYDETAQTPLNISIDIKSGTLYVDDIQLEEGEVANNYNIIDNSDFADGLNGWVTEPYALDESQNPTSSDVYEIVNFNNNQNTALKIKMNPLQGNRLVREFPIKGKKGDLYNLSFWYKNEGIPADGGIIGNAVIIYFKPVGGESEECILPSEPLNPDENIWQYFTFRYGADEDYEAIRIIFTQGREANNLYLTNLSFYKDLSNNYYEYDNDGNVICIRESSKNNGNVFEYDNNNQLISSTTPRGSNFKIEYDNVNTDRVLSAISSTGISNQVKYDTFGNPTLTRISKKNTDEITTGKYRIRSKGTDKYVKARYRNIVVESDACSNTIWKFEKVDDSYKIIFDTLSSYSLAISGTGVILTPHTHSYTFTLEKNNNGSYYLKVDSDKYLKVNDNVIEITSLINNDPLFEFYIETIDEEFIENSATYSEDGRFVTSVTDSNFNKTLYETNSTTGLITSQINAKNNTTSYTYNDKKQITSVTQGEKVVNYIYNDKNLLSKIKQGNREYNFTYDDFLNPKTVKVGENITLVTNEYNENNGNISSTTYGNGDVISYEYDEFNRIKTLNRQDDNFYFRYDSNGNLTKIMDDYPILSYDLAPELSPALHRSIIKYNYDIGKRIVKYEFNDFGISYKYDSNDNIINKKYNYYSSLFNNIENTFNKDDMLIKTKLDDSEINYEYDSLGRMINKNINDNYNTNYEYVSNGKRTSSLIKCITNGNKKYSYQYDELNNITHVYYNDELQNQYHYDEYNQLIQEEDYVTNEKIVYNYDDYGNLLTKTIIDITTESTLSTDTYQYSNSNWGDQLTKYNNDTITYDAIGNPLTIGNAELSWINGRMLDSYRDDTTDLRIGYYYNQDGIRIQKLVGDMTIKYYLENNNIIYESRENQEGSLGNIYYLYDLTGVVGLTYNGSTYYYVKNLQGDIIGILDSNYNQVVTYKYDSWGKVLSIKDNLGNEITDTTNIGIINPFRYRSYYYDNETGLYYLNSRYYNPNWGRFISQDITTGEVGGNFIGHNMYQYAFNNPVNYDDSDGSWPKWLRKVAIGVAAIAIGVAITAAVVAGSGATVPVIATAAKLALTSGLKSAVISGGVSAGVRTIKTVLSSSNKDVKTIINDVGDATVDGFSDGFMVGGVVAGSTQIISGGFKVATNLGVKGGKNSGIVINENIKILSPNAKFHTKDVGGTLINYNNSVRLDVGSSSLLHMYGFGYNHIPFGTVVSGLYGGLNENKKAFFE